MSILSRTYLVGSPHHHLTHRLGHHLPRISPRWPACILPSAHLHTPVDYAQQRRLSLSTPASDGLAWPKESVTLLPRGHRSKLNPSKTGPVTQVAEHLNKINELFLNSYAVRKKTIRQNLGKDQPVLILKGDNLIVKYQGKTRIKKYIPPLYHRIKNIAHGSCALHTIWELKATHPGKAKRLESLCRLNLQIIKQGLLKPGITPQLKQQAPLIDKYLALLNCPHRHPAMLIALKDDLDELIRIAAVLRLEALDAHTKKVQTTICPHHWEKVGVVVMGPRMPREGELSMQYAQAKILKTGDNPLKNLCPHLNAPISTTKTVHIASGKRLIYAESIDSVSRALDELTTEIADEQLGERILGDKQAMRADFLMRAATHHLKTMP